MTYDEWTATVAGAMALTLAARGSTYKEADAALRLTWDAAIDAAAGIAGAGTAAMIPRLRTDSEYAEGRADGEGLVGDLPNGKFSQAASDEGFGP